MEKHLWWQDGIIYQIYPLSFMDSNGDGYGDLPGVLSRLDYLQWLGATAIWLSPIYPSPMKDWGYDVSDYRAIHPTFGTMEDFDALLEACHERGMKLILDFVPNHTSDQHPWFQESRASRDSAKRDWYLWRDPTADGGPPNNWLSIFGGPSWTRDEATGQYYLHTFLKEQPDLNWRNPAVQEAMLDVMRFWFDKGVDGFRVDALSFLIKDPSYRDNPVNPDFNAKEMSGYKRLIPAYSADQPEVHQVVAAMRKVADAYSDRLLIGEIYLPVEDLIDYYGIENSTGVHLPTNFQFILLRWRALDLFYGMNRYEACLPPFAWPNWVLGNHDKPRIASRVGPEQARVAAMLLLTLRGTPTIYSGDEIGMQSVEVPPERQRDPIEKIPEGKKHGRDPERTPMQWSAEPNAGFTTGEPWLPVAADYEQVNVEMQREQDDSMLAFYRRLIELRQKEPALRIGRYLPTGQKRNLLAFIRDHNDASFLIAVNLGGSRARMEVPRHLDVTAEVVFGTRPERVGKTLGEYIDLDGHEGIIARLTPAGP